MLARFFIISLVVVITACVPTKPPTHEDLDPKTSQQLRAQEIAQFKQWQLKGRTIITQAKEAWHVSVQWQENKDNYQIKLLGPFAQGGLILDGSDQSATLTMSNGDILTASSPEALLAQATGVTFPVSALRDWVRGIPYQPARIDVANYNDDDQLIYLEQEEWQVEFLKYVTFEQYSLPSKLFIKHDDLSIKIIILDWDRPE